MILRFLFSFALGFFVGYFYALGVAQKRHEEEEKQKKWWNQFDKFKEDKDE